jgi:HEAT repeat protein
MLRIVLALALLSTAACANRAKRSVSLYDSGDYAGASRAADEGLTAHPDDDGLWAMKVRASLALGDEAAIAKAWASYMDARGEADNELLADMSTATIEQALASPSVRLKIAAIAAIEALEIHDLADLVGERMGDPDDRVAAAAAVAILNGFPQAPGVLDDMLRSDDAEARRIAVDGVGKKVGKKVGRLALVDIEKAADDKDARVRRAAIYWMGNLKDKDGVEILMRRLRDPDDGVRAASASALARIGIGNLEAFGTQALGDRSIAVRMAGIDLLSAAKKDAMLVTLTDDKDPLVALQAAIAVKRTRPELAQKAIDRAIASEETSTRAGAANYLVLAVGKTSARATAARLVTDKEVSVRLAAARVLKQTGDKEGARSVFTAALTDADQGLQAAADLASLDDPAGLQALSTAALDQTKSPEQRAAAASAHRTAHRVTPGLVAALADPSGLVRIEAAAVIGALAKSK